MAVNQKMTCARHLNRDSSEGRTYHAQHLCEHKIAESEFLFEVMA